MKTAIQTKTAIGVLVSTISAECSRFRWILNILNIFATTWSKIWKIPSLIGDESIAMAVAIAFECLSSSETPESSLKPDTNCEKTSTPFEEDSESKISTNAELLPIALSEAVAIECLNAPESDTISNRFVTLLEEHSESELGENREALPMASSKLEASECLSVYESISESNPSVDNSCNIDEHSESELSTDADDRHSLSELSINAEQVPFPSSKAVASEGLRVYGTPERNPPSNTTLTTPLDQHSESERSIDADDHQHSQTELNINAEPFPTASSKAVASKCLSVYDTSESNPPLDNTCNKPITPLDQIQHSESVLSINTEDQHSESELSINAEDQHSQSELSINAEDQHSQSELSINAEDQHSQSELSINAEDQHSQSELSINAEDQHSQSELSTNAEDQQSHSELSINAEPMPIASSKAVSSDCLSVCEIPESDPSTDTTCKKTVIPPEHLSMSGYNKNEESMESASESPPYASVSKIPDTEESPKTICDKGNYLTFGVSAWSPLARVSETLDSTKSPESTCNVRLRTPPAYHSKPPIESLLMATFSPSAREYDTQSPEKTCNLPFTLPACHSESQLSRNGESWSTPSASRLFAGFSETRERNQSPETPCSLPLTPLAYHSKYIRFASTASSSIPLSESSCSRHLNSLLFQSQSEFSRIAETTLFTVSFNQNFTCFACGTDRGIKVYKCDTFTEVFSGYFGRGGISIVEMHYENKTLVLVGSEDNTHCPPDKVIIWDYEFHRCIYELTAKSKVQAVKITRDHIVVVLEHEVCVYNCKEIEAVLLHRIKTLANPRGLCAVSDMSANPVLACLGLLKGQVRIEFFVPQKTRFISAHDSFITCLTLSRYGAILATASTKGTLLRIFNSLDGTCLQQVRRGAKRAEIYSIAISEISQLLAVCSDKGTVHIFGLNEKVAIQEQMARKDSRNAWRHWNVGSSATSLVSMERNTRFSFPSMKGVVPKYFSPERSFAQFHFSENVKSLVGFGEYNTIMIVGYDGSFYRCEFDPVHGGEMVQKLHKTFFESDEPFVEV